MQNTVSEKSGDDVCKLRGNPEPRETFGQFRASIEVAQVEDIVRDESAFADAVRPTWLYSREYVSYLQ